MNSSCQSNSTEPPKQKICEACGAQFLCHAPWGPCWCEKVELSTSALADLRARYADCLCPACLAKAAATQSAPPKSLQP